MGAGGKDEWVLPRAPDNEEVQAPALGLSRPTAYTPTTPLSCHCLTRPWSRVSDLPDLHRAVCKSETTPGPRPHPAQARAQNRDQGMFAE